MGFLDVLRGKRKLRQPTEDRLFAMSTAVVPMQEGGLQPTGKAAMVFQPLGTSDFEGIVVGLNAVNSALRDGGYADRVLAAVFPFRDERGQAVSFIYNVKRAAFYPFVPKPGADQSRDNERELRVKAQLERDLPFE